MRSFNYMKNKIPCFTLICFNTNNKAGLLWIMLLRSYTSSCTRRNQWSQSDFFHPAENILWPVPPWPLPWFLYSTALEMEPQSIWGVLVVLLCLCSVSLHSCGDCLIRFTLGSVLKAQWATTAESASVALWRTWQQCPQHGPSKCPSVALLLPQLLP